jgi:hypothetical protein
LELSLAEIKHFKDKAGANCSKNAVNQAGI